MKRLITYLLISFFIVSFQGINAISSNNSTKLDSLFKRNDELLNLVRKNIIDKPINPNHLSVESIVSVDSTTNATLALAKSVFDSLEVNNKGNTKIFVVKFAQRTRIWNS